jgi:hypothetical protein
VRDLWKRTAVGTWQYGTWFAGRKGRSDETGRCDMPERKHVRGVGAKEQRMYERIKESAQKSGRYGKRAEEVAARTVLKHHKEEGHKKGR